MYRADEGVLGVEDFMLTYLYEWISNLAFYLVLVTAVLQVVPGKEYKKYIQFFSGLVMILLMTTPILKLTGMEKRFYEIYHSREYEQETEEIRRQQEYFEGMDVLDFLPEEYEGVVEEAQEIKAQSGKKQKTEGEDGEKAEEQKKEADKGIEKIEMEGIRIGQ